MKWKQLLFSVFVANLKKNERKQAWAVIKWNVVLQTPLASRIAFWLLEQNRGHVLIHHTNLTGKHVFYWKWKQRAVEFSQGEDVKLLMSEDEVFQVKFSGKKRLGWVVKRFELARRNFSCHDSRLLLLTSRFSFIGGETLCALWGVFVYLHGCSGRCQWRDEDHRFIALTSLAWEFKVHGRTAAPKVLLLVACTMDRVVMNCTNVFFLLHFGCSSAEWL